MAYAVTQRTGKSAFAWPLGAQRRQVLGLVLRQSAVLTIVGVSLGLVGAAAATRTIASLLFGVAPLDAATLVVVATAFAVIAAIASWVPACGATTIDPVIALRSE